MKNLESKDLIPKHKYLIAEVQITEKEINGVKLGKQLSTKTNVAFYTGKVLKLGELATSKDIEQCPGLEEGDYIFFSQFAGATPATKDKYTKVITGHDVVALSKNEDMNIDNIVPTNDRILVKILEEDYDTNGLHIEVNKDPRELQTQKCEVIRLGQYAEGGIKVGEIVFIEPDAGNLIINDPKMKLKTVNYRDILFSI